MTGFKIRQVAFCYRDSVTVCKSHLIDCSKKQDLVKCINACFIIIVFWKIFLKIAKYIPGCIVLHDYISETFLLGIIYVFTNHNKHKWWESLPLLLSNCKLSLKISFKLYFGVFFVCFFYLAYSWKKTNKKLFMS